jgi:uncharacterized protein
MSQTPLSELIETIARALVDHPDEVDAGEFDGNGSSVIELKVARDDVGKVIGKAGRTAEAMRVVLLAASQKAGRRVHLDILD